MSTRKMVIWSVILLLGTGCVLFFAESVTVYRVCIFQCQNTGSLKGHRQFPAGVRMAIWEETSALEGFVRTNFPREFTNRWEQFVGAGVNYRGRRISWGHFRPSLTVDRDIMDRYTRTLTDAQKKELYDFLRRADRDSVVKKSLEIFEAVFGASN
jgi:hypothetical protein